MSVPACNKEAGAFELEPCLGSTVMDDIDDVDEGGASAGGPATWQRRESARLRQIMIGKARPEYRRYISEVPRGARSASRPVTPDPRARVSKRQFDRSLSEWRRRLHEYDPPQWETGSGDASPVACDSPMSGSGSAVQRSRVAELSSEAKVTGGASGGVGPGGAGAGSVSGAGAAAAVSATGANASVGAGINGGACAVVPQQTAPALYGGFGGGESQGSLPAAAQLPNLPALDSSSVPYAAAAAAAAFAAGASAGAVVAAAAATPPKGRRRGGQSKEKVGPVGSVVCLRLADQIPMDQQIAAPTQGVSAAPPSAPPCVPLPQQAQVQPQPPMPQQPQQPAACGFGAAPLRAPPPPPNAPDVAAVAASAFHLGAVGPLLPQQELLGGAGTLAADPSMPPWLWAAQTAPPLPAPHAPPLPAPPQQAPPPAPAPPMCMAMQPQPSVGSLAAGEEDDEVGGLSPEKHAGPPRATAWGWPEPFSRGKPEALPWLSAAMTNCSAPASSAGCCGGSACDAQPSMRAKAEDESALGSPQIGSRRSGGGSGAASASMAYRSPQRRGAGSGGSSRCPSPTTPFTPPAPGTAWWARDREQRSAGGFTTTPRPRNAQSRSTPDTWQGGLPQTPLWGAWATKTPSPERCHWRPKEQVVNVDAASQWQMMSLWSLAAQQAPPQVFG
eukprot:TRINITY_DN5578_c0_g1_i2.p1 TRINITY_DN5578_c0_g1~~TRINITY_DN5578_c0_g1_i2.p1  ORF type:complete len:672 (-),score=147.91 TRINITY_DN5578_c0_g1_i2:175-2190(-)